MQIESCKDINLLIKMSKAVQAHMMRNAESVSMDPSQGPRLLKETDELVSDLVRVERRIAYLQNVASIQSFPEWLVRANQTKEAWVSVIDAHSPEQAFASLLALDAGDVSKLHRIIHDIRFYLPDNPSKEWDDLCVLCESWHNIK